MWSMCSSAACARKSIVRSTGNCSTQYAASATCFVRRTMADSELDPRPFFKPFGLRIALWYATLFIVGSLAIVFLTYYLMSASLAQRDRQLINAKLGQYAAAYSRGGIDELADTV